jgi:hypothetical protein
MGLVEWNFERFRTFESRRIMDCMAMDREVDYSYYKRYQ